VSSAYPGASLATGPAAPGSITINQMYVHYRIPAGPKGVPLVLVHGSNHTGMTYETTPDGREGWATWFVRQGYPVYVVDHSGRGRSGFNPTPINAVRDGGADPKSVPTLFIGTLERAWSNFRFGPEYPKPFSNLQFPLEALDQYLMQYFVTRNFEHGWFLTSSPILTANWRAPGENQWLVPFGGGFGKMTRFFSQPMVWQMHAYYNAVHPRDLPYPKWQVRLQVALLFRHKSDVFPTCVGSA